MNNESSMTGGLFQVLLSFIEQFSWKKNLVYENEGEIAK